MKILLIFFIIIQTVIAAPVSTDNTTFISPIGDNYKDYKLPIDRNTELDKINRKRKVLSNKTFFLYSPDIYDKREILEEQVFDEYGCNGKNISPKLVWRNPPKGTRSFAITIYDNSAKTGGAGWFHWIIYNIPLEYSVIESGANLKKKLLPKKSKQNLNDFGERQYSGICPQDKEIHKYTITIYAIDVEKLDIQRSAMPAMANLIINQHSIGKAIIENAYYQTIEGKKRDEEIKKEKLKKATAKKQNKTNKKSGKNKKSNIKNLFKRKKNKK